MTNRIAELEAECWDYHLGAVDTLKFAKMIVRECADAVIGFRNQFGDSAYAEIREHFGVTE